ncbi:MAG: carboxypeptidase regulatory-like domain-containing protein [Bacteroidota bacterium]
MNQLQESKNSTYKTLDELFTANSATVTALPGGDRHVCEFRENCTEIVSLAARQGVDKSGLADTKEIKREAAIVAGLDMAKRIVAYATIEESPTLIKEAKVTETELRRLADTKLAPKLMAVVTLATTHAANLVDYGVTAELTTKLGDAITAYAAAVPQPKLGIDETKQVTAALEGFFKKNDLILHKMDALVELEKVGTPVFFQSYKNLRKVVVTGKGTLALKGLVKDAATGEGIPNADVLIILADDGRIKTGSELAKLMKRTAAKGNFTLKTLPEGNYKLTISKLGYVTQVKTINVVDGELCNVVVDLVSE